TRSDHVLSFACDGLPTRCFMATTTKKGSKNKRAKPRRAVVKTSVSEQAQTIAELRQELQDCKRQLTESVEQQTTTSEILRVIARSPTDLQSVLDVVAENAARLCEATDAVISSVDSESFSRSVMASYGSIPVPREIVQTSPLTRGTPAGRA